MVPHPDADPLIFPLNKPVLIAGSRLQTSKLGTSGTLPQAIDSIFDQIGAVVVVVRIEDAVIESETLANVIGGVDANTGTYEGVHAFLASENIVGFVPKILIAPGFTHISGEFQQHLILLLRSWLVSLSV